MLMYSLSIEIGRRCRWGWRLHNRRDVIGVAASFDTRKTVLHAPRSTELVEVRMVTRTCPLFPMTRGSPQTTLPKGEVEG